MAPRSGPAASQSATAMATTRARAGSRSRRLASAPRRSASGRWTRANRGGAAASCRYASTSATTAARASRSRCWWSSLSAQPAVTASAARSASSGSPRRPMTSPTMTSPHSEDASMTAETSNARGEAEYEYEVWQGDALQAGGSTTDYASAQSEAGHYAMMYAPDGPVEVRIYEKRLLAAAPPPADAQQQGQAVVWVSTADIATFVGAPQMAEFWGTVTLASGPGDGRTVPLYLAAAQQQGDKEVNMDVTVRDGAWVGTYAEWRRRNRV